MFNLEKLLEQAQIAEKISNGTVDNHAYNVTTKAINESVSMDTHADVDTILSKGRSINKVVDLTQLESEINQAFGINESVQSASTKKESIMNKQTVTEAAAPKKTAATLGVKDAKSFQKAQATSQTKFVDANAPAVKKVEAANETNFKKVESKGVTNANEKENFADKQKGKFQPNATKQTTPDEIIPKKKVVTESVKNAKKYISFLESLRSDENSPLIEAAIQGFKVSYKSGL